MLYAFTVTVMLLGAICATGATRASVREARPEGRGAGRLQRASAAQSRPTRVLRRARARQRPRCALLSSPFMLKFVLYFVLIIYYYTFNFPNQNIQLS